MVLEEVRWGGTDWILVGQVRDIWRAFVNEVSLNASNFLTS